MNLTLQSDSIKFIGVNADNTSIVIQDNIGFSTADLDSGFNFSDADPMYQDGSAVDYPEMDEVVAFLFAWHIPFNDELNPDVDATGTPLTIVRTSQEVLDSIDEATGLAGNFVYGNNANQWTVTAPKDGWIKFKLIFLDVDSQVEDYYYDSSTGEVKNSSTDVVVEDVSTIVDLVTNAEVNLLKTSLIDENIAFVERSYVLAKMRGECSDEEEWRRHIMLLQLGRIAAKIEFDSYGNYFVAQQMIEYLETYLAKNDLEKPNT